MGRSFEAENFTELVGQPLSVVRVHALKRAVEIGGRLASKKRILQLLKDPARPFSRQMLAEQREAYFFPGKKFKLKGGKKRIPHIHVDDWFDGRGAFLWTHKHELPKWRDGDTVVYERKRSKK